MITLTTGSAFRDPGAAWIDDLDGNGTTYASRSDFNDSKAGTYTLIYSISDRAGNPARDLNRTLVYQDPTLPLVRTLTAELDRNQSLSLHAQLLDAGGLEIAEIGIEIGTRPSLSDGNLHPLRPNDRDGFTPPIWKIFPLGWNSSTGPTQLIDWGFLTVRSARFNFLRLWTQISGGLRHWFTTVAGVLWTGLAPSCLPMRITGCTMLVLVGSMWSRTTMVDYGSGKKVSTGSGPPVHPLPFSG